MGIFSLAGLTVVLATYTNMLTRGRDPLQRSPEKLVTVAASEVGTGVWGWHGGLLHPVCAVEPFEFGSIHHLA